MRKGVHSGERFENPEGLFEGDRESVFQHCLQPGDSPGAGGGVEERVKGGVERLVWEKK